jgi:hypothetical protein
MKTVQHRANVNFGTKAAASQPSKPGKAWVKVNYSADDQLILKTLARASGLELRTVLRNALQGMAVELAKSIGLNSAHEALTLTAQKIKKLAATSHILRGGVFSCGCGEKN